MTDEEKKERKPRAKQEGMALQVDAIKKIEHQLNRLEASDAPAVLRFMMEWAKKRALTDLPFAKNGQLSLAAESDPFS